jgi:hypothetical protein
MTLSAFPVSFFSTLPQLLDALRLNESAFALHGVHVAAAAPVIDRTKRTSVKTPIALVIFFCIIIPP